MKTNFEKVYGLVKDILNHFKENETLSKKDFIKLVENNEFKI